MLDFHHLKAMALQQRAAARNRGGITVNGMMVFGEDLSRIPAMQCIRAATVFVVFVPGGPGIIPIDQ
jgi:hypothetical protein